MRFLGMFYGKEPQAMRGLLDAPYLLLGRHALCGENVACDGGAMAFLCGRLRNGAAIRAAARDAGLGGGAESDARLALLAYRLYGEEYPERLEGAVATVVVDQDAGRLVLSRDRIGENPVFYAARGGALAFSDHPAPLLNAPFVSRRMDKTGLCELFALGPARTPGRTPFADIRTLEPGCKLVAGGHGHRIVRYFRLEAREHPHGQKKTVETVRGLIEQAVSDIVPENPGFMLSGGLDSTLLTALAARRAPLRTWSVGYQEEARYFTGNDYQIERDDPFARRAAALLGAKHTRVELSSAALFEALTPAMRARGLPGMADVDASLLLFGREIAQGERCVVSGECADEVFGGYPWFHRKELTALDNFPWSGSLSLRASVLKASVREKLRLSEYAAARYHESAARQPRLSGEGAHAARLRQIHGLCFSWFMPNLQERAVMTTAPSGLTVLTPFADERLVSYVYNVPWHLKTLYGQPKGLLRAAAEGLLPNDLRMRKKSPYPKTHHPEYTRRVCEQMACVLKNREEPINAFLDAEAVEGLMASGLKPADTPWYGQLMTGPQMIAYLLQINDWMKAYAVEPDF